MACPQNWIYISLFINAIILIKPILRYLVKHHAMKYNAM